MKIKYNHTFMAFEVSEQNINEIVIDFGDERKDESICEGCEYKDYGAFEHPCIRCIRNVGVNRDRYESEDDPNE